MKRKILISVLVAIAVIAMTVIIFSATNEYAWVTVEQPLILHIQYPFSIDYPFYDTEVKEVEIVDNLNSEAYVFLENNEVTVAYRMTEKLRVMKEFDYFGVSLVPEQTILRVKVNKKDLPKLEKRFSMNENKISDDIVMLGIKTVSDEKILRAKNSINGLNTKTVLDDLKKGLVELSEEEQKNIIKIIEVNKEKELIKKYKEIKADTIKDIDTKAIEILNNVWENTSQRELNHTQVSIKYLIENLQSNCLSRAYIANWMLNDVGIDSRVVLGSIDYNDSNKVAYHALVEYKNSKGKWVLLSDVSEVLKGEWILISDGSYVIEGKFKRCDTIEIDEIENFLKKYE